MAGLPKPRSVSEDPFKSQKWDEITAGREFNKADSPVLEMLVTWYQVADQCNRELTVNGYVQTTYENKMGDIKPMPQLSTLKQASAEIRQLNKQLGIKDEHTLKEDKPANASVLSLIQAKRANGQPNTAN